MGFYFSFGVKNRGYSKPSIEYRGQGTPRVIEEKLARLEKYEELGEPSDIESQQGELEYLNEAIRVLDIFS